MKKGTSISLSVGAGVAVLFGIFACLYGFDNNVHNWVNNVGKGDEVSGSSSVASAAKAVYTFESSLAENQGSLLKKDDAAEPSLAFTLKVLKDGKEDPTAIIGLAVDESATHAGVDSFFLSVDSAHQIAVPGYLSANGFNIAAKDGATVMLSTKGATYSTFSGSVTIKAAEAEQLTAYSAVITLGKASA